MFIKLRELSLSDGVTRPAYVNLTNVLYFQGFEDGVYIRFNNDHSIVVIDDINFVHEAMERAYRDGTLGK